MKKYFLIFLVVFSSVIYAQEEKGFPVTVARYYDHDTILLYSIKELGTYSLEIPEFTNHSLRYWKDGKREMMHSRRIMYMECKDVEGNHRQLVQG